MALNTITYVPIRPHIIRKADGTGGYSMTSLNNVMALTNNYYLQNGNGIQFYFAGTTPDYIDNDALYTQYRQTIDDATVAPRDVTNALNQYYVHAFDNTSLGGYAQFPADNVGSTRTIILDENYDDDMGNRLVPHELGHTFNLLHTFESFYGYELVTRGPGANCTTAGDLVCDTPADPYGRYSGADYTCISECPSTYMCSFFDDLRNLYTPSPTNIMSYYYPCVHDFTAGQYDRIQAGLAIRQSHTQYTLDAPETVMTAPSNVVASIVNSAIVITWQDNSSNEMGYFIERSTLPTTGFTPMGGVEPNVTSFTDMSFTNGTRYYYRIRASNTTTGSISTTTMVIAPYCSPYFASDGCPYSINITDVAINGTTLSQNSGCSPSSSNYYTSFTGVSGTVTAGQSSTFTVTKGAWNGMGGSIWVDLDNNGIFETSEQLYQMSVVNTASTFSGSLFIPASITANTVAMRVVVAYLTVPSDPCGGYAYGETEDYILVIKPACIAPAASLVGSTTITAGQMATLTTSLTGGPPFSLTVNSSSGVPTIFTGISASPFSFTVAPSVSTTYTLGQVASGCSTGSVIGSAIVTVNPCTIMYTLKVGNWDDPTVWSCNHVPTQTDLVQVGHAVTIPNSVVARALRVEYRSGGLLTISTSARLRLGL
ncbi:GEVED domain-containing protein [Spirosoma arboris]|nr:GEVED domain-containing protein [Spirosoma arboris]